MYTEKQLLLIGVSTGNPQEHLEGMVEAGISLDPIFEDREYWYRVNNAIEDVSEVGLIEHLKTSQFIETPPKPHWELDYNSQAEYDNAQYARDRAEAYPSIEDQLDKIYHDGIDAWKADIKAVKDEYPKP